MEAVDVAIVGAGHAGVELAAALRQKRFAGTIALISEEPHLPYDRPPLSKTLLAGKVVAERIALRGEAFYAKNEIVLMLGAKVEAVDAAGSQIRFADGQALGFERCVLATGAAARRLPLPGMALAGVHHLRSLADSLALRADLVPGARLAVVGGGYLGLEAASVARHLGLPVTVLESAERLMPGKVSLPVAEAFASLHLAAGVELRQGGGVVAVAGAERVQSLRTADGGQVPATAVLVAVGATPRDELARRAGLACDDGILVDANLKTPAGAVYAIGDCARPATADGRRPRRVESVHSAVSQARRLAAHFVGAPPPPLRPPYFWSEQEGVKLQVTGSLEPELPCEEVVVGTPPDDFAVYRLQRGRLACVEAVGQPAAFVQGQRLIGRATLADLPTPQ